MKKIIISLSVILAMTFSSFAQADIVKKENSFSDMANKAFDFLKPETPNRIIPINREKFQDDMSRVKETEALRREEIRIAIEKSVLERNRNIEKYNDLKMQIEMREEAIKKQKDEELNKLNEEKRIQQELADKKQKMIAMKERQKAEEARQKERAEDLERERVLALQESIQKANEEAKIERSIQKEKALAEAKIKNDEAQVKAKNNNNEKEIIELKKKLEAQQALIEKSNELLNQLNKKMNDPSFNNENIKKEKHKIY